MNELPRPWMPFLKDAEFCPFCDEAVFVNKKLFTAASSRCFFREDPPFLEDDFLEDDFFEEEDFLEPEALERLALFLEPDDFFERLEEPDLDDFLAPDLEEDFLAEDFLPEDFLAEDFLAEDFLAEDFLPEDFLAEDFLPEDFLAEDFLPEDFLAEDFLAEDFLAEDFLPEDFFLALDLRPELFFFDDDDFPVNDAITDSIPSAWAVCSIIKYLLERGEN